MAKVSRGTGGGIGSKWVVVALLGLVLASALFYAFSHYEGVSQYGDDAVYAYMGASVVHGTFIESPGFIFSVRLAEAYAVGFFYYVFGIGALSSSLWNIVSYAGIIIVAFLFGRFFSDDRTGLLAAFLVSVFPLVTKFAVNMGEDVPLTFISSLAVLMFLYGERKRSRAHYMASGVLLVLAWLISYESAVVIAFVFLYAIVELARGKIKVDSRSVFLLYGIAIAFLVVFIFSQLNSGHPFITITENTRFYSSVGASVNGLPTIPSADTNLWFYINGMFDYHPDVGGRGWLGSLYSQMFGRVLNVDYGLYFYILIPIAAALVILRERRAYLPIAWAAFVFLFLEFGPMHVGIVLSPFHITYLLAHRLLRFMMIISVPMCTVIAIGLSRALDFGRKGSAYRYSAYALVALLLALLFASNYAISNYWYLWQHYPASLVMEAARYIRTVSPSSNVYLEALYNNATIGYSGSVIDLYLGDPTIYRVNVSVSNSTPCSAFQNSSYVIWSGKPKCTEWRNVMNITAPGDIPDYIKTAENPVLGYRPTNIYIT